MTIHIWRSRKTLLKTSDLVQVGWRYIHIILVIFFYGSTYLNESSIPNTLLNKKLDGNLLLYFLLIKLINWWNFVQNVTLCSYVACTTLGESKGIYHFVKGCTQALALLDSNDLTQRSVESNQCRLDWNVRRYHI